MADKLDVIYTSHAVERMQKRAISAEEIARILANSDGSVRQTMDKTIYFKRIPGRRDNLIAVVAVRHEVEGRLEILTVMNHFEWKARGTP